jgi:membrane protease YdiL (CAAX protease family)
LGGELALTASVLAYGAVSQQRIPRRWQIPANIAAALVAVALARAAGASWDEVGLEPAAAGDGLLAGSAVVAPAWGVLAIGLGLPATRRFFADERFAVSSRGELAYDALVHIPLATATAEELLFRSALLGLFLRRRSRRRALTSTAVAFGLWHVLPAMRSHDANPAQAQLAERVGGRPATVVATIAATAAAGFGFGWLRLRSRSVVAPIVAHAGLNAAARVGASLAHGVDRGSGRR